jgi:hypothetical protein
MAEQLPTPLIGPLKQRGWREVVRLRPISNTPHVALVVTRQGRLAGVIPADDRRVLSDYITWPYDFREVDMRERLMPIAQRMESCDAGYEFDASFKLIYQVERPERVAIELEDALAELEQALVQSMRATSRSFGVEQTKALEHNLLEALLYGDVLRERLSALGLVLRRADVVIELDEHARERAETIRDHMRERPLTARLAIESLDPAISFDSLIGGSYRLTSRTPGAVSPEAGEARLHDAVLRTLRRIAITFAPHDYEEAERAMADALRHDSLLQAELTTAEIELLRATVKIQPNRDMVLAAQNAMPALPAPGPSMRAHHRLPPPAEQTDMGQPPESALPWGALGQMFGREERPLLPESSLSPSADWMAQQPEDSDQPDHTLRAPFDPAPAETTSPEIVGDGAAAELPPAQSDRHFGIDEGEDATAQADTPEELPEISAADPAPLGGEVAQGTHGQGSLPWVWLGSTSGPGEPAASAPSLPSASGPEVSPPKAVEVDSRRIARWIALLRAVDPALFKLWSLELQGQPEVLPTILSALTEDPSVLSLADDPSHQHALVLALMQPAGPPPQAGEAPPPAVGAALSPTTSPSAASPEESEPPPDWLRLRRSWRDDGGAA